MKIGIASDHAGYRMRRDVIAYLTDLGHDVHDVGPADNAQSDYPIYGARVGRMVQHGEVERGIVICGSGVGISIAANKVRGVRCVLCSEPYTAQLSRRHNNTNVLALGARIIGPDMAKTIIDAWLATEYEGGRHEPRVVGLAQIESGQITGALEDSLAID